MGAESVIRILRKNISTENLPFIIAGLKHDPLVFDSLGDPILMGKLLNFASTERKFWTPANIAIISVTDFDPTQFVLFAPESWTPILQENVKSALLQVADGRYHVKNISQAAFLALGLKNKYRENLNWKETFSFLPGMEQVGSETFQSLQPVIAVLYGIVTDPQQFIRVLANDIPQGRNLAIHAVLSQPLDEKEQLLVFKGLVSSMAIEKAIDLLGELENENCKNLTAELAGILIASSGFEEEPSSADAASIKQMNLLSQLYQFTDQPKKAVEILNRAKVLLAEMTVGISKSKSRIALYKMDDSALDEDLDSELENMVSDKTISITAAGLLRRKQLSDQELGDLDPEIQIVYAAKSEQDDQRKKEIVRTAVARIVGKGSFSSGLAEPSKVLEAVERIGDQESAIALQNFFLKTNGTDRKMTKTIRDNRIQQGNIQEAEEIGQLVAAIDPSDCENHRILGSLYERSNDWEDAFSEYQYVLDNDQNASAADRIKISEIAYQTGRIKEAKKAVEDVLLVEPENAQALILAGKVSLKLGELNSTCKYFKAATDIDPESTDAWEGLAAYYRGIGDESHEIETLKKGLQFAPESGSMNYRLSQIYLTQDRFTDSLPYLQRAVKLVPETSDIALDLAKSLRGTGRMDEAAEVVHNARQKWPSDPALAFEEGEVNYFNKQLGKAVNSFHFALSTLNPKTEWYWQYAHSLVDLEEDDGLPKVLDQDVILATNKEISEEQVNEADIEKRFIQAKVAFYSGNIEQAISSYKKLFASSHSQTDFWKSRIQVGMGQAELKSGKSEIALAALKEADARIGDNLFCKKLLAEAYDHSGLPSDAEATAAELTALLPVKTSSLLWYARFMEKLGSSHESIRTYSEIAESSAGDAATLLECAKAFEKAGEKEKSTALINLLLQAETDGCEVLTECAALADKLEESDIAIAFLEKAINSDSKTDLNIKVMKAVLESKRGNLTEALNTLDGINNDVSMDADTLALRAEILAEAEDYQSAVEDLKKSFLASSSKNIKKVSISFPGKWEKEIGSDAEKWFTLSKWAGRINKYDDALTYAENALNLSPENIIYRAAAAELAVKLIKFDEFRMLSRLPQTKNGKILNGVTTEDEKVALSSIYALKAYDSFESGKLDEAGECAKTALELQPENPAAKIIDARISLEEGSQPGSNFGDLTLRNNSLGSAQLLVSLEKWDEALKVSEAYLAAHPQEPFANLAYLQTFVRTSEDAALRATIGLESSDIRTLVNATSRIEKAVNCLEGLQNHTESDFARDLISRYQMLNAKTVFDIQNIALSADRPDHCRAIGLAYWRIDEFELCGEVSKSYPRNPDLNILRTMALSKYDAQAAVKAGQWAIENSPENALCHISFSRASEKFGDAKTALQALEKAIELRSDLKGLQESAAEISHVLGDSAATLQHLTEAVKASPSNEKLTRELGEEYLVSGQIENAEELLKNFQVNFGKSANTALLLAKTYLAMGKNQAAANQAESAPELSESSEQTLIECSQIMLQARELQKAFDFARKAANLAPESPEVILQISKVVAERNSKEQALQLLEKAIEKGQNNFQLLKARALFSYQCEDNSESLAKLEAATAVCEDGEILSKLAAIHFHQENLQKAKDFCLSAINAGNPSKEVDAILGAIYHTEGNLDKAVFQLSKAIETQPELPDSYLELSAVYRARRDYKQASEVLIKAIDHVPADITLFTTLAGLLKEGKDYQGSELMLRKAMELAPDDLAIRRQLGAIVALNLVHTSPEVRYAYER